MTAPPRPLTRWLPVLLLLTAAASASAAQADYFLKIPGVEGESTAAATGLQLLPFAPTPTAALLLPAVQKVRDAAARMSLVSLACTGATTPELVIETRRQGANQPAQRYVLRDVIVTSYELRGGTAGATLGSDGADLLIWNEGDGSAPLAEHVLLTYTGLEMTDPGTGETLVFDCSGGPCLCVGR